MCVNMKRFYNKWTHSWQYSKCGKCSACQQEKANKRTQRIRNASYNGYICVFVTLTYSNSFVPYIKRSELYNNPSEINVYRSASSRKVRSSSDYDIVSKVQAKENVLSTIDCIENRIFPSDSQIKYLKKLRGQGDNDKIGVCYYKDIQNFEKRLRINLKRLYGISKPIYSFKVSEYGPTTFRPHFHVGFYIPQEILDEFTCAVSSSWTYCDKSEWNDKSIQIAFDVSKYLSSYVNRGSDFPSFLSYRPFRPHHSFSVGLGIQSDSFSPGSFFEALRNGNLKYVSKGSDSSSEPRSFFFPSYLFNRYFGKFKGYSRLSNSELRKLCVSPEVLLKPEGEQFLRKLNLIDDYCCEERLQFSPSGHPFIAPVTIFDYKQVHELIRHINLRVNRFLCDYVYYEDGIKYKGLPDNFWTRELFADMMYKFWRTYASQIYRESFSDIKNEVDLLEQYYNLDQLQNGVVHSDLKQISDVYPNVSNPNLFISVINSSAKLTFEFDKMLKKRKVTNSSMASCQINV